MCIRDRAAAEQAPSANGDGPHEVESAEAEDTDVAMQVDGAEVGSPKNGAQVEAVAEADIPSEESTPQGEGETTLDVDSDHEAVSAVLGEIIDAVDEKVGGKPMEADTNGD